jgi:putative ABC transport system permease protein
MTNTDHFDTYEEYTYQGVKIIGVNSTRLKDYKVTTMYGINPENKLKLLINNDLQNNQLLNDGIIVSDYLQTSLELKVGDTIIFQVGGVEVTEVIVGFSNELIESNFFTTKEKMNSYFNLDNTYYNGLFTTDYEYDGAYIVTRIDYRNSLDEFGEILNVSSVILNFLITLSIILSLFIFALVIISNFVDNRFDIAILKSIGYNNNEINMKFLLSTYILLVITYIISIPITYQLLNYMLDILIDNLGFKLIVEISTLNVLYGFISLNIVFALIIYFSTKYYDKINVSELMKLSSK